MLYGYDVDMYHSCLIVDIDDCANVNCTGHGTCTDLVNDYTCSCNAGYTGKNCETGRCLILFVR